MNDKLAPNIFRKIERVGYDRGFVDGFNAGVEGRPHGHWVTHNPYNPYLIYSDCSECGFEQSLSNKLNYCPNCGARMDGEREEK